MSLLIRNSHVVSYTFNQFRQNRCALYGNTAILSPFFLEAQFKSCRETAARLGWLVMEDYVRGDYEDSTTTASARPGLRYLIEAATMTPKPFDFLLVQHLGRIHRNFAQVLNVLTTLSAKGVSVHIAALGQDTSGRNVRQAWTALLNILSASSEE